jgi:FG-GAP-like repeat/Abnormal spindle-like microcephaly-assoc'd, ASPM-SPD-2-Hydin
MIADLNGDQIPDVVISDGASPVTFVLLGIGDGTFSSTQFVTPVFSQFAVADINGDGKPDLILDFSLVAQVYLGKGDGTFTPGDSYFIPQQQVDSASPISIADFNGDGKLDIAIDGTLLLGNGDGTFRGNSASVEPSFIATGIDLNLNGSPAIALGLIGSVAILFGDGSGKFPSEHDYALPQQGNAPSQIATGDVNGDGKLDLVVLVGGPVSGASGWALDVLLGNGDGTFGSPIVALQGNSSSNIALSIPLILADLNGDKILDVAVLDDSGVNAFLGQGDGTFKASGVYPAGAGASSFVAADYNNDGKIDIVVGNQSGGLGILLGNGDGTFAPVMLFNSQLSEVAATADFDSDGTPDLVTYQNILLGNGDGTFRVLPAQQLPGGGTVRVVDVNGDGKLDLVGRGGYGDIEYALGNGDGTFGTPIVLVTQYKFATAYTRFVLATDFNNDKMPDIGFGMGASFVTLLNIAPAPATDFLIGASVVSPAVVPPGQSAGSTVTVAQVGGFSGSVSLSCGSGLPTGISCSFSPPSLNGTGTSTLSITTTSSTPGGTYPVSVMGISGTLSHTVALTLTVASSTGATTASLGPTTLTFGPQASGTTSSSQAVQLTNTGATPLSISSISITGQNPGDFAQSNTCGTGIAVAATCQINVTFTPAGMGARNAVISISDNATGSPQIVALSGSGPDFSMSAGSTQTVSVPAGQTATYVLTLTPSGGFNQNVTFSCSGNPALTSCSVAPNPISLNGTTATTTTVTIMTTLATSGTVLPMGLQGRVRRNYTVGLLCIWMLAMIIILFIGLYAQRRDALLGRARVLALTVLVLMATAMSSCGGGSSGSGKGSPGTQLGTYTVTVSGNASGSSALMHAAILTLIVK